MNDSTSIRNHLFSLNNRGIKYDLDRIRSAADRCGNPQRSYKSIHVAGTNGKGSTCTYIESVLRHAGYKTALYTSPHIIAFEERFLINNSPVREEEWLNVYQSIHSVIDEYYLTFFEATTLMAFELFRRNNIDWAVFETGLGGRLDATNIIDPQVAVITHIALDHMDYLGPDLISIANEKLGIVKNDHPVVFAYNQDPGVMDRVGHICAEKNAPLHIVSATDAHLIKDTVDGLVFLWNDAEYQVSLRGSFQLINALLALNALHCIGIDDHKVLSEGLKSAILPGRFHTVSLQNKTVVFDVGHNPDAAAVLVASLKKMYNDKSICFVTGIMKDKDTKGILETYLTIADHLILTRPSTERAATPEYLLQQIDLLSNTFCEICETVASAVNNALGRDEDIICICGSFYTVGEAFSTLGINPFGTIPKSDS
jgi:dihydrofolate synthase / folylpolyglutamate synthase